MNELIIIGTGPAGLTALLYATLYGIYSMAIGEATGGKLLSAPDIINYPGIETIHGREFIAKLTQQLTAAKAYVTEKKVELIKKDTSKNIFVITCADGSEYKSLTIIIATGNGRKQKENEAVLLATMLGADHTNGFVITEPDGQTTVKGVFAAGDCLAFPDSLEQLASATATGIRAAGAVYSHLKKEKPPILWGSVKIPRR